MRLFEQLQDRRGLAETHDLTGTALGAWGDWDQAAAHYQAAVALFQILDDRQGLASSLTMSAFRGGAYLNDAVAVPAAPAEAQRDAQAAFDLARQTGQRAAEAMAAIALAFCLGPQGDYGRALGLARHGLALAEEIEHRHWICFGRLAQGALQLDLRELPSALEQLEQAQALAGELGSTFFARMAGAYLISARALAGDLDQARALFDALPDVDAPLRSGMLRQVWASRAELALAQGAPGQALRIVEQILRPPPSRPISDEEVIPRLAWLRGRALVALGRRPEAEAALRAADAAALAQGFRPLRWRILADLARVQQAQRHAAAAATTLATARTLIEELGASLAETGLRAGFMERALGSLPAELAPTDRQALKRRYGGLTTRQREVAARVAQGQSNRQIGQGLVLSQRTVEVHVANIMAKLAVDSRAQIAVWAAQNGLVLGQTKK